jgi:hypothetical protein
VSTLRWFRAAVSLGPLWGIAWAAGGVALITWRVFFGEARLAFPLQYWPRMAMGSATILGACGLAAGLLFAAALRRRTDENSVDSLSLARSVRWGAFASAGPMLVLPFIGLTSLVPIVIVGAIICGIAAVSALATIKAARRRTLHFETATPIQSPR